MQDSNVQATKVCFHSDIQISADDSVSLYQWFPNISDARTTYNDLVILEAQIVDLYRDSRITSANYADHLWSAKQTLRITGLYRNNYTKFIFELNNFVNIAFH